jgi:hypothetical protein
VNAVLDIAELFIWITPERINWSPWRITRPRGICRSTRDDVQPDRWSHAWNDWNG